MSAPALFLLVLVASVAGAAGEGRMYSSVAVKDVATTVHTHVCVTGEATLVMREADGDLHVRLQDGKGGFIVAEEIPSLKAKGAAPKKHQQATACGISRFDKKHGWYEVHPVEEWKP